MGKHDVPWMTRLYPKREVESFEVEVKIMELIAFWECPKVVLEVEKEMNELEKRGLICL